MEVRLLACALLGLCAAVPLAAQSAGGDQRPNLLSINPLGIPFSLLTVEYERRTSERASLGVATTYWGGWGDGDNENHLSADLKLRFYPDERALRGFSIGLTAGVVHRSNDFTVRCNQFRCETERRSDTWPAVAIIADYNWFLGRRRDFLVGIGVGAKRLFGTDDRIDFDVDRFLPGVRFQTGLRF